MKLFEAKGEDAIELLADLLDPISIISTDQKVVTCLRTKQYIKAIKFGMKSHPKETLQILALCDEGCPAEEYHPSALEIPVKLLQILNHPDVGKLFTSQAQTEAVSSGSATESTEDSEG